MARRERSGSTSIDPDPDASESTTAPARHDEEARDKFGGLNLGAAFFGWIVAIGVAILLTSIIGAALVAVGSNTSVTRSDAERSAGTIGIVSGVVLLVVLAVAYFAGGYVAGRMSRFDGGRQGFGVWVLGLIVTIVAIGLGFVFGNEYNVLDRVDLPNLPIAADKANVGGIITAAAVVLLTLLTAILGGMAGHRYHTKVDRAARL